MSRAAVIIASGHSEPPLAELARFRLAVTIAADPALARERKGLVAITMPSPAGRPTGGSFDTILGRAQTKPCSGDIPQ